VRPAGQVGHAAIVVPSPAGVKAAGESCGAAGAWVALTNSRLAQRIDAIMSGTEPLRKRWSQKSRPHARPTFWRATGIAVALSLAIAAIYRDVGSFAFLNYDDDTYVTGNSTVRVGLSFQGVVWAFRAFHAANWHPLTWISHMLDVSLFGMNAGAHHAVNVGLHAMCTVLLFVVLRALTGATWPAALASGLFGVHPLHVESVAWVAERKDLLCGVFFMLTLGAHVAYVRRPAPLRLLPVGALTALALLSKPMAATLPFVLLLVDWWPLGRAGMPGERRLVARLWPLVREKLPLLGLVTLSGAITLLAQRSGGALKSIEGFPLGLRLEVAFLAATRYVASMLAPIDLAAIYPYPQSLNVWIVAGAAAFLCAATVFAVTQASRRPWLLCGWIWYLGMLVPVIGLVQAGAQPWADRYTYLPLVGLFVAGLWSGAELARRTRFGGVVLAATSVAVLVALGAAAHAQVSTWRDSRTLYERAIAVTRNNYLARYNLAVTLSHLGLGDAAVAQFREAIRLHPRDAEPRRGIAFELAQAGQIGEAVEQYRIFQELSVPAGDPATRRREIEAAVDEFSTVFVGDLKAANARIALGLTAAAGNRIDEAIGQFLESVRLAPKALEPRYNLALLLSRAGRHAEAAAQYEELVRLFPKRPDLRDRLREARSR
jgi:Flp pilus assembly protein TadD